MSGGRCVDRAGRAPRALDGKDLADLRIRYEERPAVQAPLNGARIGEFDSVATPNLPVEIERQQGYGLRMGAAQGIRRKQSTRFRSLASVRQTSRKKQQRGKQPPRASSVENEARHVIPIADRCAAASPAPACLGRGSWSPRPPGDGRRFARGSPRATAPDVGRSR